MQSGRKSERETRSYLKISGGSAYKCAKYLRTRWPFVAESLWMWWSWDGAWVDSAPVIKSHSPNHIRWLVDSMDGLDGRWPERSRCPRRTNDGALPSIEYTREPHWNHSRRGESIYLAWWHSDPTAIMSKRNDETCDIYICKWLRDLVLDHLTVAQIYLKNITFDLQPSITV